jgi:hypothetical protein
MSVPSTWDISGVERIVDQYENGPGDLSERTRQFCKVFPSELAKVRRQIYRHAGLLPVPVNGSPMKGLKAGYFATRLRDGSLGYLQRRTDDCLQAALASCLQIPAHLVPDLHMEDQLAAGVDPEEMERGIREKMKRWTDKRGVRILYHTWPLTSERRWIGVVTEPGDYSDHCLLMSGRDCLFDPANLMPSRNESQYDVADIDYAITIEKG